MYNKLFTKILDSSIWLSPDPVRLVWITLLAAMDEDGNCMFACPANVAARARVTVEQAAQALSEFESPDANSGDPENDGRRVERIPGGWHLLNAHKYRAMVTKTIIREQTRLRTAKYRARDASVTHRIENVTPSRAVAEARAEEITMLSHGGIRPSAEIPELPGNEPKTKGLPECPHLGILVLWGEVLPHLPQHEPDQWRGQRADHLRARWREEAKKNVWLVPADGLGYFRKLFGFVGKSHFLTGRVNPRDPSRRVFYATLEWLVKPANWAKTIEGNYHPEHA